jgi:hypothetical protein
MVAPNYAALRSAMGEENRTWPESAECQCLQEWWPVEGGQDFIVAFEAKSVRGVGRGWECVTVETVRLLATVGQRSRRAGRDLQA